MASHGGEEKVRCQLACRASLLVPCARAPSPRTHANADLRNLQDQRRRRRGEGHGSSGIHVGTISFGKKEGVDKNIAYKLQDDEADGPYCRQEGDLPNHLRWNERAALAGLLRLQEKLSGSFTELGPQGSHKPGRRPFGARLESLAEGLCSQARSSRGCFRALFRGSVSYLILDIPDGSCCEAAQSIIKALIRALRAL